MFVFKVIDSRFYSTNLEQNNSSELLNLLFNNMFHKNGPFVVHRLLARPLTAITHLTNPGNHGHWSFRHLKSRHLNICTQLLKVAFLEVIISNGLTDRLKPETRFPQVLKKVLMWRSNLWGRGCVRGGGCALHRWWVREGVGPSETKMSFLSAGPLAASRCRVRAQKGV